MSLKLHVTPGALDANLSAHKILLGAFASGQSDAVAVVPADVRRIPFEALCGLENSRGQFVFSVNEAARYFALTAADGGAAFAAHDAATDEWLAWEERVMAPAVSALALAAAKNAVTFPLPAAVVNSGASDMPEGSAAFALVAAEAGPAKKAKAVASTATAAVLDAYRAVNAALFRIEQTLYKTPFLSGVRASLTPLFPSRAHYFPAAALCAPCAQAQPGVADWVIFPSLPAVLPLYQAGSFPAARRYAAFLATVPSFAAAAQRVAETDKALNAEYEVDNSVSVLLELQKLFAAAALAAFPQLK